MEANPSYGLNVQYTKTNIIRLESRLIKTILMMALFTIHLILLWALIRIANTAAETEIRRLNMAMM